MGVHWTRGATKEVETNAKNSLRTPYDSKTEVGRSEMMALKRTKKPPMMMVTDVQFIMRLSF